MEGKAIKVLNITGVAFSLIVLTLFVFLLVFLAKNTAETTIPLDVDEAQHAIDGWEVYLALKNLSWTHLDWGIRNQAFYPPVNSLFLAAGFFVLGPGAASGRLVTLAMFAGSVLMLGILTYKISFSALENRRRAGAASLIAAAFSILLAIASEPFILNGALVMLEMTGTFLVLPLFFFGSKQTNRPFNENDVGWILTVIGVFLIFMTKYSFGFFLPALILTILTKTRDDFRSWSRWTLAMKLSVIFLVLVSIWTRLLYDPQSFFGFFTEHPIDAPLLSMKNIIYYPEAWLYEYSPSPTWGLIVLVLSGIAAKYYWKNLAVRMAVWSLIFALVVFTISSTNRTRHILVAIPLIWFLAGLGLNHLIQRLKLTHRNILLVPLLLMFALVSFAFETSRFFENLQQNPTRHLVGKPVYGQIENFILDNLDVSQTIAIYGDFNYIHGLEALRWRAGVSTGQSLWNLHIDRIPLSIRESKLDRANRKPQISDGNPNDLQSSLLEVIDSAYYSYLVEVYELNKENTLPAQEMDPSLGQYISASADFDNWRVNVYKFED